MSWLIGYLVLHLQFLPFQALASMAAENEGRVVCPRTKTIFNLEETEKVFVM